MGVVSNAVYRKTTETGAYQLIDDISGSFNGTLTSFTLQSGGQNITAGTEQNLIIKFRAWFSTRMTRTLSAATRLHSPVPPSQAIRLVAYC